VEETIITMLQTFVGSEFLTASLQAQFAKTFGQASATQCKWAFQVKLTF